jgi:uncharacterized pyridoxal phosphate-containing UPF0001 family protein
VIIEERARGIMGAIAAALQACSKRIARRLSRKAGRVDNCAGLVAVSKTVPASADPSGTMPPGSAFSARAMSRKHCPNWHHWQTWRIEWHFIGPLQGNKTRQIADPFRLGTWPGSR